jgi:hypothetical protein
MSSYIISGNSVTLDPIGLPIKEVSIQTFTANGTYTPNANLVYCFVKAKGAGGGGGGSSQLYSHPQTGAGGGEGGESKAFFTASEIGSSQTIVVGIGGLGGNTTNDGANGTATLFGSVLVANGGLGGARGTNTNAVQITVPGAGGLASGGDENIIGQSGWFGKAVATGVNDANWGGAGGGLGGGPAQINSANGHAPTNPGCGGGGSVGLNGVGANGANGVITVYEYIF